MEKGRDDYSNKKNQNPSYTDRIMYRSLHGLEGKISVLFYGAEMEVELVREPPCTLVVMVALVVVLVQMLLLLLV
jgi:hypothetical protein